MAAIANSIIPAAIDAIQEMNQSISDMVRCPSLDEYPAAIDTADLPLCFTEPESILFGGFANNEAELGMVVRVYFDAIGQQRYGTMKADIFQLMNDYAGFYMTENSYVQTGTKVIQSTPVRIEISDGLTALQMTGYTLLEYPIGTEKWYHGFELRFTVKTQNWTCAR